MYEQSTMTEDETQKEGQWEYRLGTVSGKKPLGV